MDAKGIFLSLQLLDILTTISFLSLGIQEMNLVVKWFMENVGTLEGLLLIKLFAFVLFIVAVLFKKDKVIVRANYFYAVLVSWNLFCIYVG
ncbi:MAG: DUF5658 family protein [Candidatus Paceibacterota bacterium]